VRTDFDPAQMAARVGLRREPSAKVAPPRVADSPVALECVLHATTSFGDSTVVFSRVVHAAVHTDTLDGSHPAVERLRPLARLGRNEWSRLGEVLTISRIPHAEWPGHYGDGEPADA
jgi:flavin reductase (DIM6/NTAB) family NADH-FMN oxidoreductase RutF